MAPKKTDYSRTIIYKIVCKNEAVDFLYIDSTTNFILRKYYHKKQCNPNTTDPLYIKMNKLGGWDNFNMIEIEKFPCIDKNEVKAREQEINQEIKDKKALKIAQRKERNKKYEIPYFCICGSKINYRCKKQHDKSNKHQKYLLCSGTSA